MTTEQLKNLLSDMADEVKPMSVHKRAVAQSQRMRLRQAAFASVTALVLVGGGVAGVAALADDGTGEAAGLPTSDVNKLEGTFYEGYFEQGGGESLGAWETGEDTVAELIPKGTDDGSYAHTASLSPDGAQLAYLTFSAEYTEPGNADKIKVRDLKSGKITEVAEYSGMAKTCSEPTWAPDGRRLFIDRGSEFDERTGFVEVATGEFTPVEVKNPCNARVIEDANGEELIFSTAKTSDDTVDVVATGADGKRRTTKVAQAAKEYDVYVRELVAVSPDGRFVCVNTNTDRNGYDESAGDRFGTCDLVVDNETGEVVEPFDGAHDNDEVFGSPSMFAVPGRLIAEEATGDDNQNETQQMYDYEGKLIDEVDSASAGNDDPVLAFVPK